MSKSFNSVQSIIENTKSINEYLIDAKLYYAHIQPKYAQSFQEAELLAEHVELVQEKFNLLSHMNGLDEVIDDTICHILQINSIENTQDIGEYIKKLFVNTIVFHDFGKINENFQADKEKMDNPNFKGKEIVNSPISTHHSALGAYLYIAKHFDEIYKQFRKEEQGFLILVTLILSYSIFKHHSKYFNDNIKDKITFTASEGDCMKSYLSKFQFEIDERLPKILLHIDKMLEEEFYGKYINSFELYSLSRLNFSLLTASDYLASGQYVTGIEITDFGLLSAKRIESIYQFVKTSEWLNKSENKINYNRSTYENLETYKIKNPKIKNNLNLNTLRQEMSIEVIRNIRSNNDKYLFYIEAPTGGGKTNLSMLALIELLNANKGVINKVFYVFPFTTLITQTYKTIIETLGLKENEVTQLHSKSGYKQIEINDSEQNVDGFFGNDKKNFIDNLFINYPFCLLTHVKFFDILKTNEKESNYMLHRLANSIVVIDELQSYNPAHWDKIIYFIKKYSKFFNIKFILMSATLPKLGDLEIIKNEAADFLNLLPNAKLNYFLNENFKGRVNFNFEMCDKEFSLSEIAEKLLFESIKYSCNDFGHFKPKDSVYAIIEFIFKKSATEFYEIIIKQHKGFFNEIFVLSGSILEHRRKYIINFLKDRNNRKKKILLITTQVVEAGVDIDMDIGFKDKSLIDSDEQLAGRINRNVNKENCTLFLFDKDKDAIIYGQDKRHQEMKKVTISEYKRILEEKDFDSLYNKILINIYEWNNKKMAIGFAEYESKIKSLRYQSVHYDFKLIDKENISCFIPMCIPIEVNGVTEASKDRVFSRSEIDFLSKYDVFPTKNNEIEGHKVFDIYIGINQNKKEYINQKINEKILAGIMSKFIFSLFGTPNIKQQIILYSDEIKSEYGYKYIERWQEFYDPIGGMNDSLFYSNETQFL